MMQPSFTLRFLFGHALLTCIRMSVTARGVDGTRSRASSSSSSSSSTSSILADGSHVIVDDEAIYPVSSFRQLSAPHGGFVSDWNKDWFPTNGGSFGGRLGQGKCVSIPDNMTLCRGIGYSQMRLPNLLEHDSVKEATQQASSWIPLYNVRCHPETQIFLCSLFAPVCLDQPIWPCKSLCEAVKVGCESRMRKYGYPWPDMFSCDKFPSDNDLCIGMRLANQSDESSCPACVQPQTFESIVDNFCSADFALKIRLEDAIVSQSDLKLVVGKKKKAYKRGSLTSKELRDIAFYIENGAQCKCQLTDELMSDTKKGGNYLVMGSRKNNRLVLSFIERLDKKLENMNKAMNAIRSGKVCKAGFPIIPTDDAKRDNGSRKPVSKVEDKQRGKDSKATRKEDVQKAGKKDEKKVDGKKGNAKKEENVKSGSKKEDINQGKRKSEKKSENGKRSTDDAKAKLEKNGRRNRDKEAKPGQKKP